MNGDILVFPINTPNHKIVDLKQYLACQSSLVTLQQEIDSASEQGYGRGYVAELTKRATECRAIMAKIEEKYKDN